SLRWLERCRVRGGWFSRVALSGRRRHGYFLSELWQTAVRSAGARRNVQRCGCAACGHSDQARGCAAAAVASMDFWRARIHRRRCDALAGALGPGGARAVGYLRHVEVRVMEELDLGALFLQFLILWFLAIGGPSTIFPDIH